MTAALQPPPPAAPSAPPPADDRARRSSSGRIALLVAGGVLTAAAIGWGVLSLIGLLAHDEDTVAIAFPANVRHLVVRVDDGALHLRGTDADHVSGTRHTSRGLVAPELDEKVIGDTLTLHADCPGVMSEWCSVGYTLDVPADVSVVASDDGDGIDVTGVRGDLDLSSTAGDIRVAGASGRLTLDSSAGGIEATGLSSQVVSAKSSAGEVTLSFDRPPDQVTAHSSAGGVDVVVPRSSPAYRVTARTSAGSTQVDVKTDPTSEQTISATSSAGPVSVTYGPG